MATMTIGRNVRADKGVCLTTRFLLEVRTHERQLHEIGKQDWLHAGGPSCNAEWRIR